MAKQKPSFGNVCPATGVLGVSQKHEALPCFPVIGAEMLTFYPNGDAAKEGEWAVALKICRHCGGVFAERSSDQLYDAMWETEDAAKT